jgi:tetratricopeptide (TPR) repeat protein
MALKKEYHKSSEELSGRRLAALNRIIRSDKRNAAAYLERGAFKKDKCEVGGVFTRNNPDKYKEAIADLTRAIYLSPGLGMAYAHRADAKCELGDYESAFSDISRAVKLCRDGAWVVGLRGRIGLLAGKLDVAERAFKRALSLDPRLDWAYGGLGELSRRKGDRKAAMAFIERSLSLGHDPNPTMLRCKAGLLIKNRRWKEALKVLDWTIRDFPEENPVAFRLREHVRCELGDYSGAIRDMDALATFSPSDSEWGYTPSVYQFAVPNQTTQSLLDLLKRHPLYSQAHAWLGEFFVKKGRPDTAIAHLERALSLSPFSTWAYVWKAHALSAGGKLNEAVRCLDSAIARVHGHSRAFFLRGEIKLLAGDRKEALRDIKKALSLNPLDRSIARRLKNMCVRKRK